MCAAGHPLSSLAFSTCRLPAHGGSWCEAGTGRGVGSAVALTAQRGCLLADDRAWHGVAWTAPATHPLGWRSSNISPSIPVPLTGAAWETKTNSTDSKRNALCVSLSQRIDETSVSCCVLAGRRSVGLKTLVTVFTTSIFVGTFPF